MKHILNTIDLGKQSVDLPSGKKFDYRLTLKRINCYINKQFLEREDGIFWDLSSSRVVHFAKNIDLDTKDLQPYADGEVSYVQTWILKMKFYRWLEDNHFALKLNERSVLLAQFGSYVWKVYQENGKKNVESVDLNDIYFDNTIKSIRDTDIVQKHLMTRKELTDKREVWNYVDDVLAKAPEKNGKYCIYEFWGYCNNRYVQQFASDYCEEPLYEIEKKETDNPYYDYHVGEYRGRWLREGVVERLFKLQERINQLVNQNATYTEIASLLLMRTKNPEMQGNVLQDVDNGEIINSDDLEQIGISNTAFNQFTVELREIENKADQLCLTPQIVSGEALPSGTPFRSIAVLSNAAKSAFTLTRESIGESTGYLLKEVIFPAVVKEWNKGEIFEISRDESDVQYFAKQVRALMKWNVFIERLLEGQAITTEQLDLIDATLTEQLEEEMPKIKIPPNFFNFKFHIRTQITGESVDRQQRNGALEYTLQLVQANPGITDIPYFRQYCEENGINYWRLTSQQKQQMVQSPQGTTPEPPQADKLSAMVDTNA